MNTRLAYALLAALLLTLATPASTADLLSFWDTPRRGANSFNRMPPDRAYFDALAATGATWVRLTFSKWDGAGRDFLIGNADDYTGMPAADLATLLQVLDDADAAGVPVVIAPLSLPGARWQQQNADRFDDRLWSDETFQDQAVRFWRDLARVLRDRPGIAAYNIVNEPAPERTQTLAENATLDDNRAFVKRNAGTPRDLPRFYERVIGAIREVDAATPVMVDGGYYANPRNLAAWPGPLSDDRVLYAFHMYEPWTATSAANLRREQPLRYPGVETDYAGGTLAWDRDAVRRHIGAAFEWASGHGIPPARMVGAEFGCVRRWVDCRTYLADVIDAIESHGAHWAFYTFRPDEWDGMDYELPADFPAGRYYWLIENDRAGQLPRNGALMDYLKQRMRANPP